MTGLVHIGEDDKAIMLVQMYNYNYNSDAADCDVERGDQILKDSRPGISQLKVYGDGDYPLSERKVKLNKHYIKDCGSNNII